MERAAEPVFVEQVMARADVAIVLTRWVPHRMMWLVRELSAKQDVPVLFLREPRWVRILTAVREAFHPHRDG